MWWLYDAYRFQWDDTKGTFFRRKFASFICVFFVLLSANILFSCRSRSRRQKGKSVRPKRGMGLPHTSVSWERDFTSPVRRVASGMPNKLRSLLIPSLGIFCQERLSPTCLGSASGGSVRHEGTKITAISRRRSLEEPTDRICQFALMIFWISFELIKDFNHSTRRSSVSL